MGLINTATLKLESFFGRNVLARTDDVTLFAWKSFASRSTGLLADTPYCFKESGNVLRKVFDLERPPTVMTGKGLCFQMLMKRENEEGIPHRPQYLAPLNCIKSDTLQYVALAFYGWDSKLRRGLDLELIDASWMQENLHHFTRKFIYIKPTPNSLGRSKQGAPWWWQKLYFRFQFGSLSDNGFGNFGPLCRPQSHLDCKQTNRTLDCCLSLYSPDMPAFTKNPALITTFRKGDQKLVILVGFCTRNTQDGLWVDAVCRTSDDDSARELIEIGQSKCHKWKDGFGSDRTAVDLPDETPLLITLKKETGSDPRGVTHTIHISERAQIEAPFLVRSQGMSRAMDRNT